MSKLNYSVAINKSIMITNPDGMNVYLEEGDSVKISKIENFDAELEKLKQFYLFDDGHLDIELSVSEINGPDGHGAWWPMELDSDDCNVNVRSLHLDTNLYVFTKLNSTNQH